MSSYFNDPTPIELEYTCFIARLQSGSMAQADRNLTIAEAVAPLAVDLPVVGPEWTAHIPFAEIHRNGTASL